MSGSCNNPHTLLIVLTREDPRALIATCVKAGYEARKRALLQSAVTILRGFCAALIGSHLSEVQIRSHHRQRLPLADGKI